MEFIDPRTITGADWPGIELLVYLLWGLVVINVSFAFSMLVAHAVIPSMVATGHIPSRVLSFRPLLTVLAFLFLVAALFIVSSWVFNLKAVYGVYPKALI